MSSEVIWVFINPLSVALIDALYVANWALNLNAAISVATFRVAELNVWPYSFSFLHDGNGCYWLSGVILTKDGTGFKLTVLFLLKSLDYFLCETFSYQNMCTVHKHNYWSPRLLYWTISVAATKSFRELCCCSPKAFLSKENTRSAAAEEGCTKKSFCTADDQCGRSSWWSFHHFIVSVSALTSADSER